MFHVGTLIDANQASITLDRVYHLILVRRGRTLTVTVSIYPVVIVHLHPWQINYSNYLMCEQLFYIFCNKDRFYNCYMRIIVLYF